MPADLLNRPFLYFISRHISFIYLVRPQKNSLVTVKNRSTISTSESLDVHINDFCIKVFLENDEILIKEFLESLCGWDWKQNISINLRIFALTYPFWQKTLFEKNYIFCISSNVNLVAHN